MSARARAYRSSILLLGLASGLTVQSLWAANLTVQVRERGNGTPIAGAAVCLGTGADASQFGALRSTNAGTVVFEDILDAPLVLTVSKSGFRGERRNLAGIRFDTVLTMLLPRGGLGPHCDAPATGGDDQVLGVTNFRIDGGAAVTQRRRVSLNFTAVGEPTDYRVSESQDFADAQWHPMTSKPMFELSPGPGRKQVFLQLRKYRQTEGLSLETRSDVVSDSIELRR